MDDDTSRARCREVENDVHDALDEAFLTPELDRIDNALAEWIMAERADVLRHLVIGIDNDGFRDIEAMVPRPLAP